LIVVLTLVFCFFLSALQDFAKFFGIVFLKPSQWLLAEMLIIIFFFTILWPVMSSLKPTQQVFFLLLFLLILVQILILVSVHFICRNDFFSSSFSLFLIFFYPHFEFLLLFLRLRLLFDLMLNLVFFPYDLVQIVAISILVIESRNSNQKYYSCWCQSKIAHKNLVWLRRIKHIVEANESEID
jgi:hypothetical protein